MTFGVLFPSLNVVSRVPAVSLLPIVFFPAVHCLPVIASSFYSFHVSPPVPSIPILFPCLLLNRGLGFGDNLFFIAFSRGIFCSSGSFPVFGSSVLFWFFRRLISQHENSILEYHRLRRQKEKKSLLLSTLIEHRPDIVCLQETKLASIDRFTMPALLPVFLRDFHWQPALGSAGGLLTAWDSRELPTTLVHENSDSISCTFHSRTDQTKFWVTNVYAPHSEDEKLIFFNQLSTLRIANKELWCCIGNFNIYRYPFEENNDNLNTRGMVGFNCWINEEGLVDIDIPNRSFTWSNKRRNPTLVKLDRILVDTSWNQSFATSSARALVATTSDHIPILAECSNNSNTFRYFSFGKFLATITRFCQLSGRKLGSRYKTNESNHEIQP